MNVYSTAHSSLLQLFPFVYKSLPSFFVNWMLNYLWRDVILLTECFSRWCFLLQQKAVIIPELFKNSNTEKQDKWKSWKVLSLPSLLYRCSANHRSFFVNLPNRSNSPHLIPSPPNQGSLFFFLMAYVSYQQSLFKNY